jgi:hypothetical protein
VENRDDNVGNGCSLDLTRFRGERSALMVPAATTTARRELHPPLWLLVPCGALGIGAWAADLHEYVEIGPVQTAVHAKRASIVDEAQESSRASPRKDPV